MLKLKISFKLTKNSPEEAWLWFELSLSAFANLDHVWAQKKQLLTHFKLSNMWAIFCVWYSYQEPPKSSMLFAFCRGDAVKTISGADDVKIWIWQVLGGSKRKGNNSLGESSSNKSLHLWAVLLSHPGHLAKFQAHFRFSLVFHFLPWSRTYRLVSSTKEFISIQELMQGR